MSDTAASGPKLLAAALVACAPDQRAAWLQAHRADLSRAVVKELKEKFSDLQIHSAPEAANDATQCAFLVAEQLPDDSIALALAHWARGNWESVHNPQLAIIHYEQAIGPYRADGDVLSVARLLGNLISPYTDCGLIQAAHTAYQEAQALYLDRQAEAERYLLVLEQNYSRLLGEAGRYEEALAVLDGALAIAERSDPVKVAELLVNRMVYLGYLGRLAECEALLQRSRDLALNHEQFLTMARVDLNLGTLATAQGRPADALRWFQSALAQFAALKNELERGTVLLEQGALFERIGVLREARHSYAQAAEHFSALDMQLMTAQALVRWAAVSRLTGLYAQAAQLLERARVLWREHGQPYWEEMVLLEHAALQLAQHRVDTAMRLLETSPSDPGAAGLQAQRWFLSAEALALSWRTSLDTHYFEEARRAYEHVLQTAQKQGDHWMQRQALAGLGYLVMTTEPALARVYLEAAAIQDDTMRHALSVEELKAGIQAQSQEILARLAHLAIQQGEPLQALGYIWRAKGAAILDLLIARRERTLREDSELERLRANLARERWLAAQERERSPEEQHERRHEQVRALENQLAEQRRQHNRQLAADMYTKLEAPQQALIGMDIDVLVEYIVCGDQLLAVRADRNGACATAMLGPVEALLDMLDRLQLRFINVVAQPGKTRMLHEARWRDECLSLLAHGYERLIIPLGPLPQGATILISACDPLHLLPFAALWDGQSYLIERHELLMTPSGALLAADPDPTALSPPLVIGDSAAGKLPGVAVEVRAIKQALADSVCLLDNPDALNYLTWLSDPPSILHLAAHTLVRDDAPLFSALHLSGAVLTVEQCFELPLQGTLLVTLSGCTTASGQETGGALLAFQTALMVAGARQVLSSLWPIDDEAAAHWMATFYQALVAGRSPSAALQSTQRVLLAQAGYRHPAIWAAFALSRR